MLHVLKQKTISNFVFWSLIAVFLCGYITKNFINETSNHWTSHKDKVYEDVLCDKCKENYYASSDALFCKDCIRRLNWYNHNKDEMHENQLEVFYNKNFTGSTDLANHVWYKKNATILNQLNLEPYDKQYCCPEAWVALFILLGILILITFSIVASQD